MPRGVSYAFFVRSTLHKMDAFGQEHRIHNFVSRHGADVRNTPNRKHHVSMTKDRSEF